MQRLTILSLVIGVNSAVVAPRDNFFPLIGRGGSSAPNIADPFENGNAEDEKRGWFHGVMKSVSDAFLTGPKGKKNKKKKGGGANVKVPPFCDKYTSFVWDSNNSLLYSNLGASGPDTWSQNTGIHFSNVIPESGLPVDVVIASSTPYFPHPDIPNMRFKEFMSIGISSGSSVQLTWSFRDQIYETPEFLPGIYLTFSNFVSEMGGEGSKYIIVCDHTKIVLPTTVEPLVENKFLNSSCNRLSSIVPGPDLSINDTIRVRAMTDHQLQRSVSVLWKEVSTLRMELGAAPGPKGVHFMFAGQSNVPCPSRAMCDTYTCPKFFQLKEDAVDTYCAAEQCNDVPDRNYCCVPAVLETCEPAETLMMAPGALKCSNLAGKGPDFKEEPAIIFKDVFPAGGTSVNLKITTLSSYTPANTTWNGQYGSYGSVNVQEGTSVDLMFEFVKAKSGKPIKIRHPFIFSILDFDMQWDGGAVEKVILDGFEEYYLSNTTVVTVGTDAANRTVFKASTDGTEYDNPDDPMNLSVVQMDKTVSLKFGPTQSFKVTIGVSPGWPGSGRNFMFAGWTEIPCPKSALCIYMKCPVGMAHKDDAAKLLCQGEECSEDVDSSTCCRPQVTELCDRSFQMPLNVGSVMTSNLGELGPDFDAPPFLTLSDVFSHSSQVVDLDIIALSPYEAVNTSLNGINTTGYLKINVKSGTSVELRWRFRTRKPHLTLEDHVFLMSFYDLDAEKTGAGAESVTIQGDYLQYFRSKRTLVDLLQNDGALTFTGLAHDHSIAEPVVIPEALDDDQQAKAVTVAFPSILADVIVKLEVAEGEVDSHNFVIGGKAVIPCGVVPDMCTKFVCPFGYKLRKAAATIPCAAAHCHDTDDLTTCCERNLWNEFNCAHDRTMFLAEDSQRHSNLGGWFPGDKNLVFSNVFPYWNKTVDLVITNTTPYMTNINHEVLSQNGIVGMQGQIMMLPDSITEFQFELFDREKQARLALSETFPFWFTFVGLTNDALGDGRQSVHMPQQFIADSRVSDNSFIDASPDAFVAQSYSNAATHDTYAHPFSLSEGLLHTSVSIMTDKPSWRARFSVTGGNKSMPFNFVGSTNMICPPRQTCADHTCPTGFERKLHAVHHVCREAVCSPGDDDAVCCQPVGCNEPNMLSFSEPNVQFSNLFGMGPDNSDTFPQVIKYNNVFPASNVSVDLEVSVKNTYFPYNATHNGVLGEFGQINFRSGSKVTLGFKFVKNMTGEAYAPDPYFFTIFDIDEGALGATEKVSVKGYDWYKLGEETEVKVQELEERDENGDIKSSTVSFGSSRWGTYKDNPRHPLALSPLQLNRSVTFMMPSAEEFEMAVDIGQGLAGRNILFGGASSLICKSRALCAEHQCPPSFQLKGNPTQHVCSGEACTKDDTERCCEAQAHHTPLTPPTAVSRMRVAPKKRLGKPVLLDSSADVSTPDSSK